MGFVVWRRAARGGLPRTWRRPIQHGELTRPVHHAAVRCDQRRRRSVSIHGVSRRQSVSQSVALASLPWRRAAAARSSAISTQILLRFSSRGLSSPATDVRRDQTFEIATRRSRVRPKPRPILWGPIYKISYDNLMIILRWCQSYGRLATDVNLQNISRRTLGFSRERFTWKIVRLSEIAFVN